MGSRKGGQFERDICKQLSLWWTRNERDDVFWRTSQSGGRATTRRKKGMSTSDSSGDLQAQSTVGRAFTRHFLVEIKRGYSQKLSPSERVGILPILDNLPTQKREPVLLEWWRKALKECIEDNRKWPMIIFKRDRSQTCIVISQALYRQLVKKNKLYKYDIIGIAVWDVEIYVLRFEEFLQWCSPRHFAGRVIKRRKR